MAPKSNTSAGDTGGKKKLRISTHVDRRNRVWESTRVDRRTSVLDSKLKSSAIPTRVDRPGGARYSERSAFPACVASF